MIRNQENHNESKVIYLDTCLPDYFQGFGGSVLACPIDGNTTYTELKNMLYQEVDNTEIPNGKGMNVIFSALVDSVYDLFREVKNMESKVSPSTPIYEDTQDESVYMYFGVVIKESDNAK